MSDDLVTTLEKGTCAFAVWPPTAGDVCNLLIRAATEIKRLRGALQSSPCTCTSQGRMSIPPQPDDYNIKHWCARCRELGYDKTPPPPVVPCGLEFRNG